jgi:hypothetical protein
MSWGSASVCFVNRLTASWVALLMKSMSSVLNAVLVESDIFLLFSCWVGIVPYKMFRVNLLPHETDYTINIKATDSLVLCEVYTFRLLNTICYFPRAAVCYEFRIGC